MDLEDVRTLHTVVLRHRKASILAKGELSDSAETSKTKVAEDNLEIPDVINDSILAKDQVRFLFSPLMPIGFTRWGSTNTDA